MATFHAAGRVGTYELARTPIRAWSRNIAYQAVVSREALELVQSIVPGEYEIVFNGVELDLYRQAPAHPTEGPTIFFCGRHEERKGLAVLLEAMDRLGPDVRLWVGGTGPDSALLRQRYADDPRIQWLGRLSDPEKFSRLRGAHVFCAPSLHGESFGVVLLEAMAAGTAVVASGLAGYRNVATDEVDALLVPPGDPDALAAALTRLFRDHALGARLCAAGSTRAEQFSMTKLADHYAAVYRRIALPPAAAGSWRLTMSLWRERLRRMMAG